MLKITALSVQKNNPNRYNLFLDDRFFCGVDVETISRFNLNLGKEVSTGESEEIFESSELFKLYRRMLDFLAVRPRSEAEVRQRMRVKLQDTKLQLKENAGSVDPIQVIIDRLKRVGYLDDTQFARWWIEQRVDRQKPDGYLKIRSELKRKGLPDELIRIVWDSFSPAGVDFIQRHFDEVCHKYDLNDRKDRNRLINYLRRRGFGWDEIQLVLK